MHLVIVVLFSILLFPSSFCTNDNFNPYEVLGIPRTASEKDIRQAYKKLARHWHPDKNSEPNAHEQFTKINAAYEILSDSTKRQQYDEYGTTSQDNQRGFNTNHFRDPFDIFRAHFGGDFHFFRESPSGAKKIIHFREFLSDILPNSNRKPYLLFGSTNFCFQCRQALAIFRSLESQLNEVGIGTAEFNVNDQRLSNELGILHAPSLCVISQRRVYHFDDQGKINSYTESNIKEFLRKSIPIQRHIETLHSIEDLSKFISTYNQSNRVQAVLLTRQKVPTLKFVIPCLQYLSRIQCAVINSSVIIQGQIPAYLRQVSGNTDVVFLFKEDRNPVAILRDSDLTFSNVQKLFESNQLLHLPTISSAHVFNLVCQTNSMKPCFLLIGDPTLFDSARSSFLVLAQQISQQYGSRLAYLDCSTDQQSGFGKIFSSIYRPNEKKLFILVARRWLDNTIEIVNTEVEFDENSLHELKRNHLKIIADIEANLKLFLNTRWQNAKKYPIPMIFNFDQREEHFLRRVIDFIEDKWNYWFERNPILRSLSGYFLTYQLWLFLIPLLLYCCFAGRDTNPSSSIHNRNYPRSNGTPSSFDHRDSFSAVPLNEFDAPFLQRYTRANSPNVIILLLIADKPTDSYIGYFRQQISLIKDSRMIFAILYRERSSRWLNELYNNIESDQKKPSVRCAASSVLALYIRRKFFVPYGSLMQSEEHHDESGAYLGLDQHHHRSSSTSSNDSWTSNSETLSFMDWIDLLLDGSIRSPISITEWPMIFR